MSVLSPGALTVRPGADESAPNFARYIDLVPDGDVLDTLERQLEDTVQLLDRFGEARGGHRYGEGKWSVKQVCGHMADAERVFAYRAMCVARGETGSLPSFDENAYVAGADFDTRTLNSLLGELTAVRRATLALFRNLDVGALGRRGTANGAPVTPRALAWITAGHERHHQAILRDRYL